MYWLDQGLNSNCSEGQMGLTKQPEGRIMITRGPHYDADATIAVPEPYRNSFYFLLYFLRKMSWVTGKSFLTVPTFVCKSFLAVSTFVWKELIHSLVVHF